MASTQKPAPKSTSRWNFLSQAVASVESRLDTILADEDVPQRKPTPQPIVPKENAPAPRASAESTRPSTSANDRLQERLARAMAKKNHAKVESPTVSEPVSRSSTPSIAIPSSHVVDTSDQESASFEKAAESMVDSLEHEREAPVQELAQPLHGKTTAPKESFESGTKLQQSSKDLARLSTDTPNEHMSTDDADARLLQVQLEHEDAETKMQDEIRDYIERIDALNAKLQYLTKEAAETTKRSATVAEAGSMEKKLLERDEKIALLMEEGQKLSMSEMKHLTTIKKLRAQATTTNKDQEAIRQRAERAERTINTLDDRAKRAEANMKSTETKLSEAVRRAQDLESVTREKNALNETLIEMKAQVTKANSRAEAAESKIRAESFEMEKKRVAELEDDIVSGKVERELAEEKLRREIKDLKAALDREKDQTRAMENEMLAEQAALESRLESFRVRAEEASANDQGDAQAKLLRQIETLQSQYAAASQNWQGIEGTLLARITTLEKERDELSARESDVRRKLKDSTSKAKTAEKTLEDVQLQYATLQEAQSEAQIESQRSHRKILQLEEELGKVQKEADDQRLKAERDFARRLDEEKSRWAASIQLARIESPAASVRKTSTYDGNHLTSPNLERPASRRSSTMASALTNPDSYAASRHHSNTSSKNMYNGTTPETPILVTSMDPDEYFTGVSATPLSPDHTPSRRGVGDLVSTSTVGAGPSVQLVERMSANVRRLESEKAASKDELARLTTQRDESRQEVVRLMREVEQKRNVEQRLKELEEEHLVLSDRHQTTLELLGEKSEQVEELKADVLDVKQMYRQLADHMK